MMGRLVRFGHQILWGGEPMKQRTPAHHKLLTIPEWFEVMEKALGFYPGLAALEQAQIQSEKRKVCVE